MQFSDLIFPKGAGLLEPKAGRLLIAHPALRQNIFKRSVVLLVQHDREGSMGFILNKSCGRDLSCLCEKLDSGKAPLYLGGPMEINTLHFVHGIAQLAGAGKAVQISENLWWNGSLDRILSLLGRDEISPGAYRFFIGYSGWGSGQLQSEIDQGSWAVVEKPAASLLFRRPCLWNEMVEDLGGDYAFWLSYPRNVHWN